MSQRREFIAYCQPLAGLGCSSEGREPAAPPRHEESSTSVRPNEPATTLFLCGDVMMGRGIDQVLPNSVDPRVYEPYVKDARDYVRLAERANGPLPRNIDCGYVWGQMLAELARVKPDVRIINLETSVTTREVPVPKGINYRMHPKNVAILEAAGVDCCVLANNHVLDWGCAGLEETVDVLRRAALRPVGAGRSREQAMAPASIALSGGRGRVLVFAVGTLGSGIPMHWAATASRPGVHLIPEASRDTALRLRSWMARHREPNDIVVVSIHWGSNWGYGVPSRHQTFAHTLVDELGVNVIHGHSSHHPRGIEVYDGALILYGCGDFVNDYEGISGHEEYRDDLRLMYFVSLDAATRRVSSLEMVPLRSRRLTLESASLEEARWLRHTLDRACRRFGAGVRLDSSSRLSLVW